MKTIQAIVLDGFHKGHTMRIEYYPILKLLKPKTVTVDYCCDMSEYPDDGAEMLVYKECFRSVDQEMVLYSVEGKSIDFMKFFDREVTRKPWHPKTTLYFGYHNEPIRREDEEELPINTNKG